MAAALVRVSLFALIAFITACSEIPKAKAIFSLHWVLLIASYVFWDSNIVYNFRLTFVGTKIIQKENKVPFLGTKCSFNKILTNVNWRKN